MEPQNQLRRRTRVSSRLSTDQYQHDRSEAESSDEDDDDIPACKLPSVSPSKRFDISSTRSHANQAKRSLSDAAPGSIVLYPGSKRPRNGYNMTPVSHDHLPSLTSNSPRAPTATIETPSNTRRPSVSSEDDVFEGLVSSVNDAFHHRQTHQGYKESCHQHARPPNFYQLGEVHVDNQDYDLPLTNPTALISSALHPNSDNLSGGNENAKRNLGAEPDEEHQTETEAQTRVDTVSLPGGDVWGVPSSPGEPNAKEHNPDATHQKLQPVKKRGRPPKFPRLVGVVELLPNSEPRTGKRKQGRPRKHHPRLRDETDENYITRIARLREKSTPYVPDSDAHLPQQPPSARDRTHDVYAPTGVSRSFQRREPAAFDPENPQFSQQVDIQFKDELEEDTTRPETHAGPSEDIGNDNHLAQYESAECDDDRLTSATLSDSLDEFNSNLGDKGADQPSKDSFQHDVDLFNARQSDYTEVDKIFEGPSDDDVLAIHLDHQPLRQLCKLLGSVSWAGAKGNWQWRDFDYNGAETRPARALLPVLAKLERLYQEMPKAPNLKAQNRFLRGHANMLGYYFDKIKILVEHIRTQRLGIPEHNETTHHIDSRKRKRMTRDLVLYVIPMLTHVLASAWGLGGATWSGTLFTGAALELLKRTLGWIMRLHRRLLRELERYPLEEETENHRQQQAWCRRMAKRKEIAPLLNDIFRVIAAAPNQLIEAEARAKKELQRERQLKAEQMAAVAERKKRSLLSIHGIHYHLGTSKTGSSRPSPSLTLGSTEWSVEEQRLLFLRIQASFPVCPDLNTLRWELNKTTAQTVAMTEHLLGKMLTKVLIGYSPEERTAELRRIMRSSGVAGL
ncbi:hypothetical protein FHL15_004802 [Xylaria flabelliformis]|uniref:Uncharacterized protein n=1 Tax=Xylaria flabelliformis TaxID=2512241 RepID=A0A553I2A7_9PEZI|nr:hypothetical protein FHL15_004802 [Xylaria flabelliformis]